MKERGKIMRIFALLCVIGVGATSCSHQLTSERGVTSIKEKKHARISIENPVYDFGRICQGEKAVTTFVFRNTGNAVLNIDQAIPDIKNVTTVVSHKSLNPGKEGSIEVTLDSTGLHGAVMSRIGLITNDEERSEMFLEVMAQVQPILALKPPFIFVGQVAKEGSFSGKAELIGKLVDEGRLRTLTINKSSPAIEARIRQRAAKNAILEFILGPEQKAGSFEESITLISKDPPAQAQLLLFGQKLGDIRVTPDRLEFFPQKGMKANSHSILFECDKQFKIIKVEDLSGFLKLAIKVIEEGYKYELIAKLKSQLEGGSLLGVVKVHTDLEEHPLIHIPIIGQGS